MEYSLIGVLEKSPPPPPTDLFLVLFELFEVVVRLLQLASLLLRPVFLSVQSLQSIALLVVHDADGVLRTLAPERRLLHLVSLVVLLERLVDHLLVTVQCRRIPAQQVQHIEVSTRLLRRSN